MRKPKTEDRLAALRIVSIYAVVSCLWISLSDNLLGILVPDPGEIVRFSILKGISFITLTVCLLYILLVKYFRQLHRAEEERESARDDRDRVRSELHEAEMRSAEALRASEEKLRFATLAAELGTWNWNVVHDKVECNGRCRELFSYPPEVPITLKSFLDRVHEGDRERVREAIETALREQADYLVEMRVMEPDGSFRWLLSKGRAFYDEAGFPHHMDGIVMDITEGKNTEVELVQAKNLAETASGAKTQFLANMSHELRTPLNGVLGMLQLVLGGHVGEVEPRQRELLQTADKCAQSLLRIIGDILDMTKLDAGKLRIEEIPFSLADCVRETVDLFAPDARQKGLELVLRVSKEVPVVAIGDHIRLRQVLLNLIGNGIKFTGTGGVTVEVEAGRRMPEGARDFVFIVSDTGIGIAREKQDLLFRPFSQIDYTNTRRYGGTGLGLAISKQIVEGMGGSISFTSREGAGTTFRVTVPLREAATPSPERTENHQPGACLVAGENVPRILVAEDDAVAGEVLEQLLTLKGLEMDLARSGQEAVELWERGGYDLIIMDVQMPRMDGLTATRIIRERERSAGRLPTPIIAMTAHAFREDEQRCLDAGMDGYLSKPLELKKAMDAIARYLAPPA